MRLFLMIVCVLFPCFLCAQPKSESSKPFKKKAIVKELKAQMKNHHYAKAEELLVNSMKDFPNASSDVDLLNMAMNIQYQLYLEENRKIYLDNKGDTALFFNRLYQVYQYGLKCDSLASMLKEKVHKHYYSDVNSKLSSLRNNLRSGGKFFLKNQHFDDAFRFFDMYLSTIHNPVVYKEKNENHYFDDDSVMISKMTVHAAYGARKYESVIHYLPIALSDSLRNEMLLEMGAEASIQIKDSCLYEQLLTMGMERYHKNDYFKANLIKYYHTRNDVDKTLLVLDKCIEMERYNTKYLILKGNELAQIGRVDDALDTYQQVVNLDEKDGTSYVKMGELYLQKASSFYQSENMSPRSPKIRENRKKLQELYNKSLYCFEKARMLLPESPQLWKEGLREMYYKLNKGKELKELESKLY